MNSCLQGDPTYLVVTANNEVEKFGINAVCTHLGCVVPWVGAENKFKCPCHGSQYDSNGMKIRGPAPLVRPAACPVCLVCCAHQCILVVCVAAQAYPKSSVGMLTPPCRLAALPLLLPAVPGAGARQRGRVGHRAAEPMARDRLPHWRGALVEVN